MRLRTRIAAGAVLVAALAASGPLTARAYDVDAVVAVVPFTISRTVNVLGIASVTVTVNSPVSLCTYVSADNADPGGTPEVGVAGTCPVSGGGPMTLVGCANGIWSGSLSVSQGGDTDTYQYTGVIVGGLTVLGGVDSTQHAIVGAGTLTPTDGDCVNGFNGISFAGFIGRAGN